MEKNTIIAIVLSVVIITAGFYIQEKFFAPPKPEITETAEPAPEPVKTETAVKEEVKAVDVTMLENMSSEAPDPDFYKEMALETDVFSILFSNRGGTVKSIKLKEHLENDEPLEMINKNDENLTAFNIHLGDYDSKPLNIYFNMKKYKQNGNYIVEFSKDLDLPDSAGNIIPLSIVKKYIFKQDEYLFELQIQMINRDNKIIKLNNDNYAYTLSFGPQIGPEFEKLDGRKEFRKYITVANRKKSQAKLSKKKQTIVEIDERINWAAISGKYFAVIGIPDATLYKTVFSNLPADGFEEGAQMFFSRPEIKSSNSLDTFKFYVGPKSGSILKSYNEADRNSWSVGNLDLDMVLDSGAMLGWLQKILKVFLNFFYGLIPNYGVAIILLTLLIKIILFPLTHKSYESTSKMSGLTPKMNEIKEKYKNNPQKMNAEVAALYKKEGVNPLGGCLPMLLQMPIFIALYGLLNSHFELRGAEFIAPWITDLSLPDSIWNFAPVSIPVIGSDIRLLPILMIGTQIFSSKIMQTPETANNAQMKMMTYMMPAMFLFILYDAPAGLLLYWTMTNVLTTAQQLFINRRRKKKSA